MSSDPFPPPFPSRPTLYTAPLVPSLTSALPAAPLPTPLAYTLAHRCHALPFATLAVGSHKRPDTSKLAPDQATRAAMECLVGPILGRLRDGTKARPVGKLEAVDSAAQMKVGGWGWREVFGGILTEGLEPEARRGRVIVTDGGSPVFVPQAEAEAEAEAVEEVAAAAAPPPPAVTVETAVYDGRRVLDEKAWTIATLKAALGREACEALPKKARKRDIAMALAERVVWEGGAAAAPPAQAMPAPAPPPAANELLPPGGGTGREDDYNFLPYSDLSAWGVDRQQKYRIPFKKTGGYTPWELYTLALHHSPYNPAYWTARAYYYYQTGHYDLALGDCYRALLLVEPIVDATKRSQQPGLYPRAWDAIEQHIVRMIADEEKEDPASTWAPKLKYQLTKDMGVPYFTTAVRKAYHHIISLSLIGCDALRDYETMDEWLTLRLDMRESGDGRAFVERREAMKKVVKERETERAADQEGWWANEARMGWVGWGPWEDLKRGEHDGVLEKVNREFIRGWAGEDTDTPALRVERETDEDVADGWDEEDGAPKPVPGLKVVANRKIARGEIVYAEEPSLRGHHRRTEEAAADIALVRSLTAAHRPNTSLVESRVALSEEGFKCENCKRDIPRLDVEAMRKIYARKKEHRGRKMGCGCLFQDPIVPFCTAVESMGEPGRPESQMGAKKRKRQAVLIDTGGKARMMVRGGRLQRRRRTRMPAALRTIGGSNFDDDDEASTDEDNVEAPVLQQSEDVGILPTVVHQPEIEAQRRVFNSDRITAAGRPVRAAPAQRGLRGRLVAPPVPPSAQPDTAEQPTCLEIALSLYHHRACSRDWKWLHAALPTTTAHLGDHLQCKVHNEQHGCHLALLLREVFDVCLGTREGVFGQPPNPHLAPHEIDALLPLAGGDEAYHSRTGTEVEGRRFPFGWAANIAVPFDILQQLGVDIWRELDFDTWSIQLALRKLALNAVPWDGRRRDDNKQPGEARGMEGEELDGGIGPGEWGVPVLQTLYVQSGFGLFNHGCAAGGANAVWSWDEAVQNRVVVWADRELQEGEEVRVRYWPDEGKDRWAERRVRRLLGRKCGCGACREKRRAEREASGV